MMRQTAIRLPVAFFLVAFIAMTLGGCGGSDRTAFRYPSGPDADGGTWRTIVMASGTGVVVPAPPGDSSPQTADELAMLGDMQAQRTPAMRDAVSGTSGRMCLAWNAVARNLVASQNLPPTRAARVYALLSIAQYDALVCAWHAKFQYARTAPSELDPSLTHIVDPLATPPYPSEDAVVASASADLLAGLFPGEAQALRGQAEAQMLLPLWNASCFPSDVDAGDAVGRHVAQQVLAHAATDGSDAQWNGTPPVGPGVWYGILNPPAAPVTPHWGNVRPWLMTSGDQFRAPPPPAVNSPEFQLAVDEVRNITRGRTMAQTRIASYWQDGQWTHTPPGHWNDIACELAYAYGLNELRSARVLALLNMTQMDAGIAAWDSKYTYWLIRPSQFDPRIDIGDWELPNFPAYTSGHSSFSGAAGEVLAYLFPTYGAQLRAMAEESGLSRIYGGVHYSFDNTEGLRQGRRIASLAIEWARADGADVREVRPSAVAVRLRTPVSGAASAR